MTEQVLGQIRTIRSNIYLSSGVRLAFVCSKRPEFVENALHSLTSLCFLNLKEIKLSILNICEKAPIFPALHSIHSILLNYDSYSNIE